jgi:hypothetical protein
VGRYSPGTQLIVECATARCSAFFVCRNHVRIEFRRQIIPQFAHFCEVHGDHELLEVQVSVLVDVRELPYLPQLARVQASGSEEGLRTCTRDQSIPGDLVKLGLVQRDMALQSPLRGRGVLLVVPPGISVIVLSCRTVAVA